MSRYRLQPTREQETILLRHCSHARYVWNLAVEQHAWWRPGRDSAPGYLEQSRQLTAARAGSPWLAEGSQTVQQQALRDFARAMAGFFAGTHGRPSWRKAGRDEGFRVTGQRGRHWDVRRLNRNWGQVRDPEGRLGAVPLVPRRARGRAVVPGDPGPGGPLARRVRRSSPIRSRGRGPGRRSASTGA